VLFLHRLLTFFILCFFFLGMCNVNLILTTNLFKNSLHFRYPCGGASSKICIFSLQVYSIWECKRFYDCTPSCHLAFFFLAIIYLFYFIYCCEEGPHRVVHDCLKKVVCQTELLWVISIWTIHQSSHKLQETIACMIYKPFHPGLWWTSTHKHTGSFLLLLMCTIEQ